MNQASKVFIALSSVILLGAEGVSASGTIRPFKCGPGQLAEVVFPYPGYSKNKTLGLGGTSTAIFYRGNNIGATIELEPYQPISEGKFATFICFAHFATMNARFCFVDKVTKEKITAFVTRGSKGLELRELDIPGIEVFEISMTANRFSNPAIRAGKNLLLTKIVFRWGSDEATQYRYIGRVKINGEDVTAAKIATQENCTDLDSCPNFTLEDKAELRRAAAKARLRSRKSNGD